VHGSEEEDVHDKKEEYVHEIEGRCAWQRVRPLECQRGRSELSTQ
jgi:hypothetical protein